MEDRTIPLSKFTAASRGFHGDSMAFELNNRKNHGKISVLSILHF